MEEYLGLGGQWSPAKEAQLALDSTSDLCAESFLAIHKEDRSDCIKSKASVDNFISINKLTPRTENPLSWSHTFSSHTKGPQGGLLNACTLCAHEYTIYFLTK